MEEHKYWRLEAELSTIADAAGYYTRSEMFDDHAIRLTSSQRQRVICIILSQREILKRKIKIEGATKWPKLTQNHLSLAK